MTQGYIARGPFNPPGTAYRASLGPGLSLWVNPGSEMRSSDNACYRTLAPIKPATTRVPKVQQGLSGPGGAFNPSRFRLGYVRLIPAYALGKNLGGQGVG